MNEDEGVAFNPDQKLRERCFDKLLDAKRWTPEHLSKQPPQVVAGLLKEVCGLKNPSVKLLPAHVAEYVEAKAIHRDEDEVDLYSLG